MSAFNRREALKSLGANSVAIGSVLNAAKWATPAILIQSVPSHAQASDIPVTDEIPDMENIAYDLCFTSNVPTSINPPDFSVVMDGILSISNLATTGGTATAGNAMVDTEVFVDLTGPGPILPIVGDTLEFFEIPVNSSINGDVPLIVNFLVPPTANTDYDITVTIVHFVADPAFGEIPTTVLTGTLTIGDVSVDANGTTTVNSVTTTFGECA